MQVQYTRYFSPILLLCHAEGESGLRPLPEYCLNVIKLYVSIHLEIAIFRDLSPFTTSRSENKGVVSSLNHIAAICWQKLSSSQWQGVYTSKGF